VKQTDDVRSPGRSFIRAVIVVALAAFVLAFSWPNVLSAIRGDLISGNPFAAGATVPSDFVITDVTPGTPAERGGVRTGDRIDLRSLTLAQRLHVLGYASSARADTLRFDVIRNGVRTPIALQADWPQAGAVNAVVLKRVINTIFILVGATLVMLRPSRMLWGFYLYALSSVGANPFFWSFMPPWIYATLFEVLTAGFYTVLGLMGLWVFVARFPGDAADGWRRWLDRYALPVGIFFGCVQIASDVAYWSATPYPQFLGVVWASAFNVALAVAIACLASGFIHLRADQRQRFKWVFAAFAVYATAAGYANLSNYLPSGGWPVSWTNFGFNAVDALNMVQVIIPLTVSYAVLRHRVLDVNFVLSRALVYGIITTLIVGVFAIIDWVIGRALEHQQLAIAVELVAAVGFGFTLNGIHKNVDSFVDRVLFRQRHFAEQRLERVANGLPHANSSATVDEMLVEEPAHAFGLTSAAVFRRSDSAGVFVRQAETDWPADAAAELRADDPLVIHLQGERGIIRLRESAQWGRDFPPALAPTLAIPLMVRHQLDGVVLYGAHRTGEDFDVDEIRCLEHLAVGAAAAYDHIAAEELRRRIEQPEAELTDLRGELLALRSEIVALRTALANAPQ
jgi:hypothetical protein